MIIARGYLSDCIKVDSKFKDMLMEEEFWIYVDIIQDDLINMLESPDDDPADYILAKLEDFLLGISK